jgi:hypothetical protein
MQEVFLISHQAHPQILLPISLLQMFGQEQVWWLAAATALIIKQVV